MHGQSSQIHFFIFLLSILSGSTSLMFSGKNIITVETDNLVFPDHNFKNLNYKALDIFMMPACVLMVFQ